MSDEKIEFDWNESTKSDGNRDERRGLSEAVKKIIASGVSSAFMTEDGIRSYLSDLKLPKDVLSQILKGAKKSRDEVIGKAGSELTRLIRKIDLSAEFRRILEENKINIRAEIDFVPKAKKDSENTPEASSEDDRQIEFFES